MPAEILQLTDLHLLGDPAARLKGVPTRESLRDVLQFIEGGTKSGKWDFDYLVITGDLAHDEQLSTYEILRELISDWVPRCRLIPGNHDDRALIRQVFPEFVLPETSLVNFSVEVGGWRLIGLDTHAPGEVLGRMDNEQLEWLGEELTHHQSEPTIVFMHHPPFPVRSAWLDRIGLQEPELLLETIQSHSQVRVVCTGHIHQVFEEMLGDVQLLTTPATAVQFQPQTELPICDPIPPGFRMFKLVGDTFQSEVVRLPELIFPPES